MQDVESLGIIGWERSWASGALCDSGSSLRTFIFIAPNIPRAIINFR